VPHPAFGARCVRPAVEVLGSGHSCQCSWAQRLWRFLLCLQRHVLGVIERAYHGISIPAEVSDVRFGAHCALTTSACSKAVEASDRRPREHKDARSSPGILQRICRRYAHPSLQLMQSAGCVHKITLELLLLSAVDHVMDAPAPPGPRPATAPPRSRAARSATPPPAPPPPAAAALSNMRAYPHAGNAS